MTQQQQAPDTQPFLGAADEPWRVMFFAGEWGRESVERPAASGLDGWTTDQLFAEALKRSADDAPALRLMQGRVLRALLLALDRGAASGRG